MSLNVVIDISALHYLWIIVIIGTLLIFGDQTDDSWLLDVISLSGWSTFRSIKRRTSQNANFFLIHSLVYPGHNIFRRSHFRLHQWLLLFHEGKLTEALGYCELFIRICKFYLSGRADQCRAWFRHHLFIMSCNFFLSPLIKIIWYLSSRLFFRLYEHISFAWTKILFSYRQPFHLYYLVRWILKIKFPGLVYSWGLDFSLDVGKFYVLCLDVNFVQLFTLSLSLLRFSLNFYLYTLLVYRLTIDLIIETALLYQFLRDRLIFFRRLLLFIFLFLRSFLVLGLLTTPNTQSYNYSYYHEETYDCF